MKSVMPFSGGVDSTYAAWKTLRETDNDLDLVFFDLSSSDENVVSDMNYANATTAETVAVAKYRAQKIASWLTKNVRPVNLIILGIKKEMVHHKREGTNAFRIIMPILLNDINNEKYDQILGAFEKENDGAAHGGSHYHKDGTVERGLGSKSSAKVFQQEATRGRFDLPLLEMKYTHANAFAEMPRELFDMTLSCDAPVHGVACGECFKCVKRKFFCEQVSSGASTDQIYDRYIRQCSVDGRWWSMKHWVWLYTGSPDKVSEETWKMPEWPVSINKGL